MPRRRRVVPLLVALLALVAAALGGSAQRAGGSSLAARVVPVVGGLETPVFVTSAPGDATTLFVVEQTGRIRVVRGGKVVSTFLDVSDRIVSGGEQGLLGLAFAPDYATSGTFVVDYTDRQGDTNIVRFTARDGKADMSSATVLVRIDQPYANHNGGMVVFGPDGKLYVGMGDGGSGGDPENRAQNMRSRLGKLLRLDVKRPGSVAIAALGLRNPWRFSFDRATKDLWIGDVGQNAIEEVDHVAWPPRGLLNFGWDVYEGRASYERKALGPGRLVRPVAQYPHALGCSITGGYVYRGSAVSAMRGRYLYGDYCSGTLWSLRLAGGKAHVTKLPFTVKSLVSFGEDGNGELYLVSHDGTIYRLAA